MLAVVAIVSLGSVTFAAIAAIIAAIVSVRHFLAGIPHNIMINTYARSGFALHPS